MMARTGTVSWVRVADPYDCCTGESSPPSYVLELEAEVESISQHHALTSF